MLRFEEQHLTSFAGLVLLQSLFQKLDLKARLSRCFAQAGTQVAYGAHLLYLHLVVHLLMGFRSLRHRDHYRNDPMVQRLLGVRRLADVSTLSRTLGLCTPKQEQRVRDLSRELILDRLRLLNLPRVTLDFDGTVLSTRRQAEGTAVGFNKKHKGHRSYYPLLSTVAQTGQFLDFHHRPGNVHDSKGAAAFMAQCLDAVREALPGAVRESRMDAAFFNEPLLTALEDQGVEFTATVPFERFPPLKQWVLAQKRWHPLDAQWSYAEASWKPKCWSTCFRIVLLRQKVLVQRKGPLQLDLFVPRDFAYQYKVIVTNKTCGAQAALSFHNGRGSQEGLIGEAKVGCALDYIPMRRRIGNQLFTAAALMAHNLTRELQMLAAPPAPRSTAKRAALWTFETLKHLRLRVLQRAGRFTAPQGTLTLTMSANAEAQRDILRYLDCLQSAS